MPRITAEGVVLNLKDRGEADMLVSLLTPSGGPLRAMARQAKWSVRRFGGRLGLTNRIRFDYSRKATSGMAFIEETELIERFPLIPRDPARFGRCMTFAEIIESAWGEGDPAEELYGFFIEYLRRANRIEMDADRHYLEAFRLLAILGHRPALDRCASCAGEPGRSARISYSAVEGGALCAGCAEKVAMRDTGAGHTALSRDSASIMKVHGETLRTIEAGLSMSAEKLGRLKFTELGRKEARAIWIAHTRVLLGRSPSSIEYLNKIETQVGLR